MRVKRRGSFLAMASMAVMAGAVLAGSAGAAQAGVDTARAGGTWHNAVEVTGPPARADASLGSVACPSGGNCAAGGYYVDRSSNLQALVVTEQAGHWGKAIEVPGTGALNAGGFAGVDSVACPSKGNCAADGHFETSSHQSQMFVVNEIAGKWGQAHAVPGRVAVVASMACPSPGNCATGGNVRSASGQFQAFVINETNGTWGQPVLLSGAGFPTSDYSAVQSVTCASAGKCTASGTNRPGGIYHLFAVSETGGQWGQAVRIALSPAISRANQGVGINSMSCASPGNCAAAGSYAYAVQDTIFQQPFVISETGGTWGSAVDVPGLARPAKGGFGDTSQVACAAPDTCTAGGFLSAGSGPRRAFLVTETGGHWGHVIPVTGAPALGGARPAEVDAVSCTAPGTCVAGGYYNRSGSQAFVVTEAGGRWGQARPVPGLARLNVSADADIHAISCSSASRCTAVGSYGDRSQHFQAFAASKS
jgi:hypothetical protein